MKQKKSQITMFESIAILVVFFILLMFGFMFYARVIKSTGQENIERSFILDAIEISQKAAYLPELGCTRNNILKKGCIDLLKLESAMEVINQNSIDYFYLFGYSKVYVKEIYPSPHDWTLYDFQKKESKGKTSTPYPVSIYNPITDSYSFGILYVETYR